MADKTSGAGGGEVERPQCVAGELGAVAGGGVARRTPHVSCVRYRGSEKKCRRGFGQCGDD